MLENLEKLSDKLGAAITHAAESSVHFVGEEGQFFISDVVGNLAAAKNFVERKITGEKEKLVTITKLSEGA